MGKIVKYLSSKQLKAIEIIIEGIFTKPYEVMGKKEIGDQVGVSEETVRKWYKDEKFMLEVNKGITEGRLYLRPKVWKAFSRHLDEPLANPKVMQLYLENIGEHVKKEIRANINLTGMREDWDSKSTDEVVMSVVWKLYNVGIDGRKFDEIVEKAKVEYGKIEMREIVYSLPEGGVRKDEEGLGKYLKAIDTEQRDNNSDIGEESSEDTKER